MPTECAELVAARHMVPEIRARAAEAEAARQLPEEIVRDFAEAGLIQMAVPKEYGGLESHALDLLRVMEEISYADGSAGWVLMNYQTTALVSGLLPKQWGEAIFASEERAVPAGVLSLTGRGKRVDGGIVVSGRWGFGSGGPGANWVLGAAVMEQPADAGPEAKAEVLLPMFPREDVVIHDTWHVSGLCGTGSHDVEVKDVFVPEGRWVSLVGPPTVETTLYQVPIISLFPPCVVAVSIGIARAALECFEKLAEAKVPNLSKKRLAERAGAQIDFAKAEALIDSGRSYVFEATDALWEEVARGEPARTDTRRRARLASAHAAESAARAVDLLYTAAGTSAIFSDHPLQRHWRDIHATTQHVQISPSTFENMGRLRLTGILEGPF